MLAAIQTEEMRTARAMKLHSIKIRDGESVNFNINCNLVLMDFSEIPSSGPDTIPIEEVEDGEQDAGKKFIGAAKGIKPKGGK
jgi:hypothetical protein